MNNMWYLVQNMNTENKKDALTLGILQTIDKQNNVTQRHLAERLGVALGLANSYLKRCVKKGLVKIEQAPANRYLYYLTPKGFAEKGRLTANYLTISFDFYRHASSSCMDIYRQCEIDNYQDILICGVSELAEIALLRSREFNLNIVGFHDHSYSKATYLGLQVWNRIGDIPKFDVCVLTALNAPQVELDSLLTSTQAPKILIPEILDINLPGEQNVED